MRRANAYLRVAALLGGCAPVMVAEHWTFEKLGTPEAELKRDQSECFARSIDAANIDRAGWLKLDRTAHRTCMEQRGYTVRVTAR